MYDVQRFSMFRSDAGCTNFEAVQIEAQQVNNRTITIRVPHKLTQAEARRRIEKGVADLQRQYAGKIGTVQQTWTGDRMEFKFSAMGQSMSGRIDIEPSAVVVNVDLPWLLAMLADKIKPQIQKEASKMLEDKR
jgi:putative polyhydroxyalkanoate system protein